MKIKKPSRKTKQNLTVAASVVGASALIVGAGVKYLDLYEEFILTKTNLLQAYTLIKKMDELHPDAVAEAVKACDKELIEALIAQTS